ncbi:MAG: PHP domain-containing protein [Erysipelotrichaceae bacterium]|nr:PHP domain-containing protein [Erysipelotrichaceae bacterium]
MIDLHCHSTYSDGTCTPLEILELAQQLDLHQLAITDHNGINGALNAKKIIQEKNLDINFVIGCELSVDYYNREVHLLGYFNIQQDHFDSLLEFIEEGRKEKLRSQLVMIEKLNHMGLSMSYEEIKDMFPNTVINRVHMCKVLMDKGYISSVNEGFDKYLGEGKPCYESKKCGSLEKAVEAIHHENGKAVLAHPFQYVDKDMEVYLSDALSLLDGIECFHPSANHQQSLELLDICQRYHLISTGGSDFHGDNKPNIQLGCQNVKDQYIIEV